MSFQLAPLSAVWLFSSGYSCCCYYFYHRGLARLFLSNTIEKKKMNRVLTKLATRRSVVSLGIKNLRVGATALNNYGSLAGSKLQRGAISPYNRQPSNLGSTRYMSSSIVTEPLESLGDSITTAVLLSWSKEPGDPIKEVGCFAYIEPYRFSFVFQ